MLSSSNLKSGQADSYFEQDDYYSQEEGPGGSRWLGKGAEELGLSGGVEKEDFSQVLKGRSPEGELLFSREVDQKKRRAATDFTFSAPKSVSVAGLVQGDERVVEAHHLAVERTLAILEERYAETRVMTATGRKKVGTGNIIAAVFAHGTSREAEPQIHSHCVVMNATQIDNGRWYSLLNDSAIANKKLLGQIYQNELAVELQKLGYEIEQREHGQFDIKGYSSELLETFSTRRGQIEALVEEWKESGKVVRDAEGYPISSDRLIYEAATLRTRKAKPQIVEAGKLLQNWKAVLAMKGLALPDLPSEQEIQSGNAVVAGADTAAGQISVAELVGDRIGADIVIAQPAASEQPADKRLDRPQKRKQPTILDDAIAHCGERDAIFEPKHIEKFVFEHHIGATSIADLQQEIGAHPELIDLGLDEKGKAKVTTETALQLELQTIRLMQSGQSQAQAIVLEETVARSFEGSTLSEEQQQAIASSCASADQVIGWQGAAGAGKTYGLNAFKHLAEAGGYTVSGYAPSSSAAHELGESLKIQTETVARLLISEPLEDAAEQKQLWLVDEAGLLSMKNAHELLVKAQEQNARVVLVGDTKQLSAVESGNPFKSLQAGGMQTFHLDETRRQKKEELRQAVQLVAAGQVGASIDVLQSAGYISEIAEESDRIAQVAGDFLSLSAGDRAETLVLAGTNKNRLALTEEIRKGLQGEGSLGGDAFVMQSLQRKDLTDVQGRYARSYAEGDVIVPIRDYKGQRLARHERYVVRAVDTGANTLTLETPENNLIQIDPKDCDRKAVYSALAEPVAVGDRLKWTKNDRVKKTRNGQQFTVTGISADGTAQTIDDDGNHRELVLLGYQHVDYAWISTTYSSQGKTAERVLALMDQATVNKEAFYVATSRAKNDLHLYTGDVKKLRERADETRAKENVSDYLPLFELVENEQPLSESTATADHAREIAGAASRSSSRRQRAAVRGDSAPERADNSAGSLTPYYVGEFSGVPERVEGYVEQRGIQQWAEETTQYINGGAQQMERTARSVNRLNQQLEREARRTRSRRTGSRWPNLAGRGRVEKPVLKADRGAGLEAPADRQMAVSQRTVAPPVLRTDRDIPVAVQQPSPPPMPPASLRTPAPIEFKPLSPESSLRQQLDDFAQVLGYAPGDRLYVRALLPKNLSDEMAVRHRLKFEIEENGKKRLIPNTRRGYLTVGSWEFTHIRKDKDPTVHADGLAKLAELNKEGRGIYFVVNPGGEKDSDISSARTVFWENDDKTKAEQIKQVQTSGLPLGAVVETNKSIHCYIPLAAPMADLDEWKKLQERLIQRMESDPAIRNSSRLMRLPGFDHVRVEGTAQDERLAFTPVTLRHVDQAAKGSIEEVADKLPQWNEQQWGKETQKGKGRSDRNGEAVPPTLAADNPWDIRNFAQHLNGDHYSQNGWFKVQCPHHGGDGHSGDSLGINEATGQYTCYSGCDTKDIYRAAWELAESRGWTPPEKKAESSSKIVDDRKPRPTPKPVLGDAPVHVKQWRQYGQGVTAPPGKARDFQIARNALAAGLPKKAVLELLAKNSSQAKAIYKEEGSSSAYNYTSTVVNAAIERDRNRQKGRSKGIEL